MSASLPIPVTKGLKYQVNDISCDYSSKMISALKTSTDKRLSMYEYDDTYVTSAVLDPRFKVKWCHEEIVDEPLSVVKQMATQVETATQDILYPVEEDLSPPRKMIKPNFFSFMSRSCPKPKRAMTEQLAYLAEPCSCMKSNPMDF